jgi:hypothetical protein
MALAITLNVAAGAFLLLLLVATMWLPFKVRRAPAGSPAQLRAWRAWLDPRPAQGSHRRARPAEQLVRGRADEAPSSA